jgi:NADPH-dependent 2,4-dienoyl-CoA reductase/sulfur reductase-like enzyme
MNDSLTEQLAPSGAKGTPTRVLVGGGVAVGGASCATRLQRLDESVEIVVFERGPYVSFANCRLP